MRQDIEQPGPVPGLWGKEFLMPEGTALPRNSDWSAERSALVAEVLRGGEGLDLPVRLRVHGESMLPALWPGNAVEIAGCSLKDVRPGEILLALRDGRFFLHRLVASQPNGFVLRGDSMPGPDPQYPPEALLGRLVRGDRPKPLAPACSRAVGRLLCHCGWARRLALKLHRRQSGSTSAHEFRSAQCL